MRKIGVQEIARLAKVSIGTVDRALHGRKEISESTRKRILRIAKQHGYRPNLAARALSVGGPLIRIGVCIPREIHYFYDQLRDGFLNEARRFEQLGVEIVYRPVERLGGGELAEMKALLARNLQVIAICPGDPASLKGLIDEAEEGGVRVICVASDAPRSGRSTVICVNPEVNANMAAELMAKFLPPRPEVAIVTGMLVTEDHRKKVQAFSERFQHLAPGGKLAGVVEGHDDEDETFQKAYALLGRHKALKGIYVSTANCLPVCHAVGARGLHGSVRLITTDLFNEMVPYLEKGTILASIHQRPYVQGQIAVRLAVDHVANGRPIPPAYYLTPHVVLRSNLHLFREIRSDGVSARVISS